MREAICGMLCVHVYMRKTQLHLLTAWLKQQIKHSLIGPLQVYPPSCMPGKASISGISVLIILGALLNFPNPVTVIVSLALWGLSAKSSLKSSSPTDVHSSGPWNMSPVNSSHLESPRSSSPPSPNRLCILLCSLEIYWGKIFSLWAPSSITVCLQGENTCLQPIFEPSTMSAWGYHGFRLCPCKVVALLGQAHRLFLLCAVVLFYSCPQPWQPNLQEGGSSRPRHQPLFKSFKANALWLFKPTPLQC